MTVRPAAAGAAAQTPRSLPAPTALQGAQVARTLLGQDAVSLHPAWSRSVGAGAPPAVTPQALVVGTRDGRIEAVSPDTGEALWAVPVADMQGAPVVGPDGAVYAVSGKHQVLSLNPDGTPRWSKDFEGWVVGPPAVGPEGTMALLVKKGGDRIFSLDAATGERRWDRHLQFPYTQVSRPPVVAPDGTILAFDGADHTLWGLDPQSGRQRWKVGVGDLLASGPTVGKDGTVYYTRAFGDVVALDPATGKGRWHSKVGASPAAVPSQEGPVFVRAEGNKVAALDPQTGGVLWDREVPDVVLTEPAVDPSGNLVVGGSDGVARALDAQTGAPRWTAALGGDLKRAVSGPEDEVFFADGSGRVMALHPQQGAAEALSQSRASGTEEGGAIQVNRVTVTIGGIELPIQS